VCVCCGDGIEAIYASQAERARPGIRFSVSAGDLAVTGPDQVWCADITYVPMARGLCIWCGDGLWSRFVLAWRLSNTMESAFCVDAWEAALRVGERRH